MYRWILYYQFIVFICVWSTSAISYTESTLHYLLSVWSTLSLSLLLFNSVFFFCLSFGASGPVRHNFYFLAESDSSYLVSLTLCQFFTWRHTERRMWRKYRNIDRENENPVWEWTTVMDRLAPLSTFSNLPAEIAFATNKPATSKQQPTTK